MNKSVGQAKTEGLQWDKLTVFDWYQWTKSTTGHELDVGEGHYCTFFERPPWTRAKGDRHVGWLLSSPSLFLEKHQKKVNRGTCTGI